MERWERPEALKLLSGFLRDSPNRGRTALVAGEARNGKARGALAIREPLGQAERTAETALDISAGLVHR
jgi:hypothetical protein